MRAMLHPRMNKRGGVRYVDREIPQQFLDAPAGVLNSVDGDGFERDRRRGVGKFVLESVVDEISLAANDPRNPSVHEG